MAHKVKLANPGPCKFRLGHMPRVYFLRWSRLRIFTDTRPTRQMVLEVCVESARSALAACSGGARRLELCSSLCLGGLTPSLGLFRTIKKLIPPYCPVFVMIRPKPGENYLYDDQEVEVMIEDISIFRENGADGFVFGCLDQNKDIDEKACRKLLAAAGGRPCTFHRAFDVARNPSEALGTLIRLGFSRVLTSGQEATAHSGRHLIKDLVSKSQELGSSLVVVAGGGISEENLREILEATGVEEFHGSARARPGSGEANVWLTDEFVVKRMVQVYEKFKCSQRPPGQEKKII